jgi:hypothetical protein
LLLDVDADRNWLGKAAATRSNQLATSAMSRRSESRRCWTPKFAMFHVATSVRLTSRPGMRRVRLYACSARPSSSTSQL